MDDPESLVEAQKVLRRVLDAVERGDLSASTPQGQALVRRLEGAVLALEALEGEVRSGENW